MFLLATISATTHRPALADPPCSYGAEVSKDGKRRLALIVGVSTYPHLPPKNQLDGPARDAEMLYNVLTDPLGFGFPKQNVCLLQNGTATRANLVAAFQRGLIAQAQKNDIVVFYFSGHGGQRKDVDGDENDGLDETILLSDSTPLKSTHLVDDKLGELIDSLKNQAGSTTIFMDSCNSASNTRGSSKVKFFDGTEDPQNYEHYQHDATKNSSSSADAEAANVVQFSAAQDGDAAIELNGTGVFTEALLSALQSPGAGHWTLEQLKARMDSVSMRKAGHPIYTFGKLNQPLFGGGAHSRAVPWVVQEPVKDDSVRLKGPILPGFGIDAELRIYRSAEDLAAGDIAKSVTAVITEFSGASAVAKITETNPASPTVNVGDLATLARPAPGSVRLGVSFRPTGQAGGIDVDLQQEMESLIAGDELAQRAIHVGTGGDYEVSLGDDGQFVVRGPENSVRWSSATSSSDVRQKSLVCTLLDFALQKSLMSLPAEGGKLFQDNDTLKVSFAPYDLPKRSCAPGTVSQSSANQPADIKVCGAWTVNVLYDAPPTWPSLVLGGFVASADGSLGSLVPPDGSTIVKPGATWSSALFQAGPSLATVPDYVTVIGMQPGNEVDWSLLTDDAICDLGTRREADTPMSRILLEYATSGSREKLPVAGHTEQNWTRTVVPYTTIQPESGVPQNACDRDACGLQ